MNDQHGVEGRDLTAPQLRAMEAVAAGLTREEAAKAAGVGVATIYRWLRKSPTKDHLRSLSDACVDRARRRFQTESDRAARTLVEIAQGKKPAHPAQVAALIAILDRVFGRQSGPGYRFEATQTSEGQAIRIIVGHPPREE
jgi:transcriptional regulator with XRE-family HTH domain